MTWNNGVCLTSSSQTVYPTSAGGYRYVTLTAPDGSSTVSTYQNGRLLSVVRKDSGGTQISSNGYAYDAHGRQNQITDARNGTTTYAFNNADQVSSITTPSPGWPTSQITTYSFDNMGRAWKTTLPDNTCQTNRFDVTGLVTNTSGSRTYPSPTATTSKGGSQL